jgi:hypothetical protein
MDPTLSGEVPAGVSDPHPTRVSLPRHVYVLAALFAVLMLGLLAFQLVMINDQRTTTDEQLAIQARQSARAIPVLDRTRPLIDQVNDALPETQRLGRDLQALTREARPLVEELDDAQVDENLRAAGALAATLIDADVGDATRAGRALAAELLRADLPLTTQYVNALASEFLHKHRLRRLLVRSLRLAPTLQRVVPQQAALLEESLAVQRELLEVGRRTLEVAREAERHAESLDNKTGGSGTTTAPPPTEGPVP